MAAAGERGRTVVVKVGSSTLTNEQGRFRLGPMAGRVAELCELWREGNRVLLVSSGAVSAGMGLLHMDRRPTEIVNLQAASAVGQGRLFHTYSQLFAHEEVLTAQVLLTALDISARTQYLNARNTLRKLLEWRVIPIINENDTTSTDELCFGDNDILAAQVALLVEADLLLLLTDTDGLYSANPQEDPEARLITDVRDMADLEGVQMVAKGTLGSGGMESKIAAARAAMNGGVRTVIGRGTRPGIIRAALDGEPAGTVFHPKAHRLGAFKLWLLYGKPSRGRVTVDEGAAAALRKGSSLLPVGVTKVEGSFAAGDAVTVLDPQGGEMAKGIFTYSSDELDKIKGLRSEKVATLFPTATPEAAHRDYLVLVQ